MSPYNWKCLNKLDYHITFKYASRVQGVGYVLGGAFVGKRACALVGCWMSNPTPTSSIGPLPSQSAPPSTYPINPPKSHLHLFLTWTPSWSLSLSSVHLHYNKPYRPQISVGHAPRCASLLLSRCKQPRRGRQLQSALLHETAVTVVLAVHLLTGVPPSGRCHPVCTLSHPHRDTTGGFPYISKYFFLHWAVCLLGCTVESRHPV